MSLCIYATAKGKIIFGFDSHSEEILAPDADRIAGEGGNPYLPNPAYVEGAGFDMSEGNLMQVLDLLDLPRRSREFDPVQMREACTAYLAGHPKPADVMTDAAYFHQRITQLERVASVGIAHGADVIHAD